MLNNGARESLTNCLTARGKHSARPDMIRLANHWRARGTPCWIPARIISITRAPKPTPRMRWPHSLIWPAWSASSPTTDRNASRPPKKPDASARSSSSALTNKTPRSKASSTVRSTAPSASSLTITAMDPYGFIAVIVRLLADGAVDLTVDDALERGVLFVKADELDLAEASGFFGGLEALRSVVGEEADHAGQIRL